MGATQQTAHRYLFEGQQLTAPEVKRRYEVVYDTDGIRAALREGVTTLEGLVARMEARAAIGYAKKCAPARRANWHNRTGKRA